MSQPADNYHNRIVRRQIQRRQDEIAFLTEMLTDKETDMTSPRVELPHPTCCFRCEDQWLATQTGAASLMHYFIVCGECGNKRCPKATDHTLACTDSNEPNQPGSEYTIRPRIQDPDHTLACTDSNEPNQPGSEFQYPNDRPQWDQPTPSGHVYKTPTTVGELQQRIVDDAQGDIESWDRAERVPAPTWAMVGIALTALAELEEALTTRAESWKRASPDTAGMDGY